MDIEPGVLGGIVDGLPVRLRRRADELAAAGIRPDGPRVEFAKAVVTLADADTITRPDQLQCDCLLAPRCAHVAAVALSLPVSTAEPAAGAEASDPGAGAGQLSAEQRRTLDDAWGHLARALQSGWGRMPATLRSTLAADLHRMRVHGLVVSERALTGLLTSGRVADAAALALNLWRLRRCDGEAPVELVGRLRREYREVGGLVLRPMLAEPVLTASRFAGVQVTWLDAQCDEWRLFLVQPGTERDVVARYRGAADWGGLAQSPATLSRHGLTVSNATAGPDGRLGGGARVRAAMGRAGVDWERLPGGFRVVDGAIAGGDRESITVGASRLHLSRTALQLGAGPGLELLSRIRGAAVACLVRGDELLGMKFLDDAAHPPDELGGVWWPGLDAVTRDWAGELEPLEPVTDPDPGQWPPIPPDVALVIDRWLERVLHGGAVVLEGETLGTDVAWLRRAGAAFAGDLLAGLGAARQEGSRRFDGTWEPDPDALLRAWLALATY